MKKVSFLILLLLAMITVVSCSNNDEENNTKEDTNNNQVEESSGEKEDTDQSDVNQGVMSLGETGYVDDEIGQYEVTPNSFEFFKERDGETPMNESQVFVLIDYTVKILSDEGFSEDDLLGIRLLLQNTEGDEVSEISNYSYEFVDYISGDIEPGESYDSQMLFEIKESESSEYILHFGSPSSKIEDAEWSFTESEAK